MKKIRKRPLTEGMPYPLGANWDGKGVNFALFSANAERIELCLFDESGLKEVERIPLHWRSGNIWHCYVSGLGPGAVYGYRAYGSYEPTLGHRFNPNKLLLDPYTKKIKGSYIWHTSSYGYLFKDGQQDLSFDRQDNAPYVPKSVVSPPSQPYKSYNKPKILKRDTVIYEAHVKGLTALHPDVPDGIKGTFMGMSHPSVISYLKNLGVTSIELLPVFLLGKQDYLEERNLENYWGYDPVSYFVLDPRFGVEDVETEFRHMIHSYHEAGLEIILDVVYNHTGEGNELGPTWSFRGIDNQSYYALSTDNPRYYQNDTGCGNIFNLSHPRVNQLVMDSLRYWANDMGVDGFRFDLAATLIRDGRGNISSEPNFFAAIRQDPILNKTKLIAEPWDMGRDGWQTGNFPDDFSEWNDIFRDTARKFWNGQEIASSFSGAIAGSSHIFNRGGRRPQASINFITAHDGFTLHDLVSYNHKHNEANKENNQDGSNNNSSNNYGAEGETKNKDINQLRWRQKRNFMATLILSQGIPMITAGDEYGRSQQGNNNAWCQDNEISWMNWDWNEEQRNFYDFTRMLLMYRKYHPIFRRIHFLDGRSDAIPEAKDIIWLSPTGFEMKDNEWGGKCFGFYLPGDTGLHDPYTDKPRLDDRFLALINATPSEQEFKIAEGLEQCQWSLVFDTFHNQNMDKDYKKFDLKTGRYKLESYSVALFRERKSAAAVNVSWRDKE
ncbi:MAG: glycogen debranching protein GlgX [Alphaproteobacteria bacterium]